jgi:hypothetical protein
MSLAFRLASEQEAPRGEKGAVEMAAKRVQTSNGKADAVMRAFVRGRLGQAPEFARSVDGVGVCRLLVVGQAAGPASSPPRVSLYIRDGAPELRDDEAMRCSCGLNPGDLIEAVGNIGPERRKARRQEVLVSEQVKLRERAAA